MRLAFGWCVAALLAALPAAAQQVYVDYDSDADFIQYPE